MLSIYISNSAKSDFFLVANRITKDRESGSFRLTNFIGNYFFSFLMFPILGLRLPDVLSGAKIFPKKKSINKNIEKVINIMSNIFKK